MFCLHQLPAPKNKKKRSPQTELYQKIAKGHYHVPSYFSAEAKDLLARMLDVNRHRRFTLDQVLAHPWVLGAERASVPRSPCAWLDLTRNPNADSLAELVSYGFNAEDARRMLATETSSHPIVSLYHLVDKARIRREQRWQQQVRHVTAENARRTAVWESRQSQMQTDRLNALGDSADTIVGAQGDEAVEAGLLRFGTTESSGATPNYADLDAPLDPRLLAANLLEQTGSRHDADANGATTIGGILSFLVLRQ